MCMHELGLISSGEHAWVKPFSFAKGDGRQKTGVGGGAVHGGRGGNPGSWAWNDQAVMN